MSDVSPSVASVDASARAPIARRTRRLGRLRISALTRNVVIASAVALGLGLIGLGAPSLWVDESFTARAVHFSFVEDFTGQYHWLYYSLMRPWAFYAGTSEAALRFPSVLGAMLACGFLVLLAHKLFDSRVALLSGLFLATSPFVVKWSQQARGYTLLLALGLLATLLLLRALEQGSRGAWVLYGLAFALVLVWHPVGGLLLAPAHAVLGAQRHERVLPHGVLAAVLIVALAGPWVGQIAMRSTGEGAAMNWLKAPSASVATRTLLEVSGIAGLGVLLAIVGLVILARTGEADLAAWLGTWAFAPFVLAVLVSTVRPIFLDRYLIVAAPAFALLAGVAVLGLATRLRAVAGLGALIATSVGLVLWYSSGDRGNWRGEDWRGAVQTVLAERSKGDAIVVVPWSASAAAAYYGAPVSSVSTASSIWALSWSETRDESLSRAVREPLGFGDHRLVASIQFGPRLSLQHWVRKQQR
jgi:mannosyltransferase